MRTKTNTRKMAIKRTRVIRSRKRIASRKSAAQKTTIKDEAIIAAEIEAPETSNENSFFYTSDKFFNQCDSAEVINYIMSKYPEFAVTNDDTLIKKTFIQILQDEVFMQQLLKTYNITIHDLFIMLYKNYASIFKGPYLKKVKNELDTKTYVKYKVID